MCFFNYHVWIFYDFFYILNVTTVKYRLRIFYILSNEVKSGKLFYNVSFDTFSVTLIRISIPKFSFFVPSKDGFEFYIPFFKSVV